MARWKCNAIYPGTYYANRIIAPGIEFQTPDSITAREMWLPLDDAAHAAVARAKAGNEKAIKEAQKAGEPPPRAWKTLVDRTPTPKETREVRPEEEIVMGPAVARKAL